jgi:predicted ATPase/DNA-binding winged helix-turn-helix (wHTH) protein
LTERPPRGHYRFDAFRLLAEQDVLVENDRPVQVSSRALDVLRVLLERAGALVTRRELMAAVWPDTFVGDANLNVHISSLRRVLGDGEAGRRYIVSVPGRGYRFVAPVTVDEPPATAELGASVTRGPNNLPRHLRRLIGRDAALAEVVGRLSSERLLTILGSGGKGKTALALAAAERLVPAYEHGVWLVPLASLDDTSLLLETVASVVDLDLSSLDLRSEGALSGLVAALADRRMLLVLDNCEHVIAGVAALGAAMLREARGVAILATSREPLLVEGERTYRLAPLAIPDASELTAHAALAYPAVELFVERVKDTVHDFRLSDADTRMVVEVCRTLGGIPLAIEFAAARTGALGIGNVVDGLQERLLSLRAQWRTAPPRHRTLEAVLDWSFRLLSRREQELLARLSIFTDGFTLAAAQDVAGAAAELGLDITEELASLVRKSLVSSALGGQEARFRLLEVTRAYAARRLVEMGEAEVSSRRHAAYFRALFENEARRPGLAVRRRGETDDVRSALRWCFSPAGDRSIGIALAAASAPLWFELSLLNECHSWMSKALEALGPDDLGGRLELALRASRAASTMFAQGGDPGDAAARRERGLADTKRAQQLANDLHDSSFHLPLFAALVMFRFRKGDIAGALAVATECQRFAEAVAEPVAMATADCMAAAAHIGLGHYATALASARRGWALATLEVRRAQVAQLGLDHSSWARGAIATALWHLGSLDQSNDVIRELIADAIELGHAVSLGTALIGTIYTLSLGEQLESGVEWLDLLARHSDKHGLANYAACSTGFKGLLALQRGDLVGAERMLRTSLDELGRGRYELIISRFLAGLADVLRRSERFEESLATLREAQRFAERGDKSTLAESIRLEGQTLLAADGANARKAEDAFRRSIAVARKQGSLSSELRAAQSLGELYASRGRKREAHDLVAAVYARFGEGFDTGDLRAARRHLESWAD